MTRYLLDTNIASHIIKNDFAAEAMRNAEAMKARVFIDQLAEGQKSDAVEGVAGGPVRANSSVAVRTYGCPLGSR